jgi:hypothetical protein
VNLKGALNRACAIAAAVSARAAVYSSVQCTVRSAHLYQCIPQVDYYNSEAVGQYEVGQVMGAYKNEADSWSI